MATNDQLPTKASFLRDNLHVTDSCDICHEPFDATHHPTRICTAMCKHTFGSTCLAKWFNSDQENNNKCPTCRQALFRKTFVPTFTDGTAQSSGSILFIEAIDNRKVGEFFARCMWDRLRLLYLGREIADSEIQIFINQALCHTAKENDTDHPWGLYLGHENWPAMQEISKEMILVHYQNGGDVPLSESSLT
ncbi:hypothetical protein BU26DRAFT_554810 [Trematosphaeria pertusa]|uniref:RING-type domain-containing protein n=1 Tax=Trematosphaeria pertusa TaxID=390896 RepID=A0A6A6I123_9PLEO|nr:uncharacterized protein BU26DRAFT_554810 [Trematosphaeria pertusa]KAF2243270.1 hypothetical protein BU26DRAFT_554810 [Trematosphaeria pertusa]